MQDREGDEGVSTCFVPRRELIIRSTGGGEQEVSNQAGDEGADCFQDRPSEERPAPSPSFDQVQGRDGSDHRDTSKDRLDRICVQAKKFP